jgi:hypothetical protein
MKEEKLANYSNCQAFFDKVFHAQIFLEFPLHHFRWYVVDDLVPVTVMCLMCSENCSLFLSNQLKKFIRHIRFEFFCPPVSITYNAIKPSPSRASLKGQGRRLPQPIYIDTALRKLWTKRHCRPAVRIAGSTAKIQTSYLPDKSNTLPLCRTTRWF